MFLNLCAALKKFYSKPLKDKTMAIFTNKPSASQAEQSKAAERALSQAKAAQITAETELRRVKAKYPSEQDIRSRQEIENASRVLARSKSDVSIAENNYHKIMQVKNK